MRRLSLALAVTLAIPATAHAQSASQATPTLTATASTPAPAPPPAPPKETLEVRVIGDKADSLQKIPGSGTVISTKDLERTQPADTAEILRRVPGLQVREEEGGGFRLDIGVRGLDPGRARRVLMLEDGIPTAVNPYAESDTYYITPVERMRGIEVVKGSGSILFGPQTTGGVINIYTLAPPSEQTSAVEIMGGDRGYKKVLGMYGDSIGPVRYIVQGFYKQGDGFRGEAFNSTDIFGKLAFDTSSKGEATLKLGFHDDIAYSDDVGLTGPMYAADPERPTLAPYDQVKQQRYEASLIHEQHFSENTTLRTLLYAYTTNRIWRRQDYTRSPTAGHYYDHIVGDESINGGAIYFVDNDTILDRRYNVAGAEPRLEHRFTTGSVGHTVDVGGRILAETAHYQQRTGGFPQSYSGSNDNEETHRTYAFAGYLQDRIALLDKLLVTPGIRIEHAEFQRNVLRGATGNGTADSFAPGDTPSTGVIPGIGMIFGTRSAHVFTGLHLGYAPPRLTDAISPKGVPAQLSPEVSYNYELGTRIAQKRWLHFETTVFYSKFTNQVVSAAATDAVTELVNGGETRHYGIEAATTVAFGPLLRSKMNIDVGVRYTFARATFVGGAYDGNFLPYAPLHTFGTTLDIDHPNGLGGQVSWSTVSSQFTDEQDTRIQDVTGRVGLIPSYEILDLGARYRHKPTGLTARLLVKSALNDIYISARRPEGIHAAGFREIMLGLRWDTTKGP